MRILLQFPEGLKEKALEYADKYEKEGNEVFISASPTFGACDLAIDEAKNIKADKLVHFGHAEFKKVDFNVEYIDYKIDAKLDVLNEAVTLLENNKKIGVVTTIQHVHQLDEVKKFFESKGIEVVIGKPYGLAKKRGQILGCDVGSAASIDKDVDAFVYFGGGIFHPLGAAMQTSKLFISADPFSNRAQRIDNLREVYKKKSKGKVLSAINAKRFGIMVSTKNGQHNMNLGIILKKKIEENGMIAQILVANTFNFLEISNIRDFDAFVNTACPRIAIDDTDRIDKPLLSSNELMELIEMKKELIEIKKAKNIL